MNSEPCFLEAVPARSDIAESTWQIEVHDDTEHQSLLLPTRGVGSEGSLSHQHKNSVVYGG